MLLHLTEHYCVDIIVFELPNERPLRRWIASMDPGEFAQKRPSERSTRRQGYTDRWR